MHQPGNTGKLKRNMGLFLLIPVVLVGINVGAQAQLRLAKIFTDNMMLQRDRPICVWGKAIPGIPVSVTFAQQEKTAWANPDSSWRLYFNAQGATHAPQHLTVVSGGERVIVKNILIGDIWLCIGQSNMEWPMIREEHYPAEKYTTLPSLRFFNPTYAGKNVFGRPFTDSVIRQLNGEDFYKGAWQPCDSASLKTMSAVAYYFGKKITTTTQIPIGLINLAIGGAPLETFIAPDAFLQSKQFATKLQGDWLKNNNLPVWARERGQTNIGSKNQVASDEYGKNHAYKPGFAFKAGIGPLLQFPIKGILNYQGESNAQEMERVEEYNALSELLVNDYRQKWKENLPYYFVQLSSIDTLQYNGRLWPEFRNEQRKLLAKIPNCGMAVCSDIGARNDVHPTNKKAVGERLARWALHNNYSQKMVPGGPLPIRAVYARGKVVITFRYIANGLKSSDGGLPKGFSLDGLHKAEAVIEKGNISIKTNGNRPEYVFYGWKPYSDGNLVNSENLPCSSFKLKIEK